MGHHLQFSFLKLALAALVVATALPVVAQTGGQATRMIVPFGAGGAGDQIGRTLARYMTETTGRQMIVENREGAGGTLGILAAARSEPDGNTLVVGPNGAISIAPHLRKLDYDPATDLAPVSMVGFSIFAIAVNSSVPVKSLGELLAWAKRDPDGVNYAHSGVGSNNHLAGELLKLRSGANLVGIPYKGGSAGSVRALLSGETPMGIADLGALRPQAEAGKVRILAVINSARSVSAPDIPIVAELGFPGYAADAWATVFAPGRTPPAIIERYSAEFAKVLALPEVRSTLLKGGTEVKTMPLKELRTFLAEDSKRWADVIKRAKIKEAQ